MMILGPTPCHTCQRAVSWDRVGYAYVLMEKVGRRREPHRCRRRCVASYARGTHYPNPNANGRCADCLGPLRPYRWKGQTRYRHAMWTN